MPQAVFLGEFPESRALIPKRADFRADPDKTRAVLKQGLNRQIRQALLNSEILKRVLLRLSRARQAQGKRQFRNKFQKDP